MEKLLLHICCGPCSTHPATLLSQNHQVVGYFYNPNVFPYEEWLKRYEAFKIFAEAEGSPLVDYYPKSPLNHEEYESDHKRYLDFVRGLEKEPEGGARCSVCFRMRLDEAARFAKENKIGIFTTTLTIGRNKRPEIINPIGCAAAEKYSVKFFEANFKKQDGALKGKKISDEHGLYRQHYCGCEFGI